MPWTEQEDLRLVSEVQCLNGNLRLIAERKFPTRSLQSLKERWKCLRRSVLEAPSLEALCQRIVAVLSGKRRMVLGACCYHNRYRHCCPEDCPNRAECWRAETEQPKGPVRPSALGDLLLCRRTTTTRTTNPPTAP